MQLVTRKQLGWPASAAPSQSSAKGVKVHYEGTPVSTKLLSDHDACLDEWKNIRRSHLANTAENYSDVAYNYAACPHGYLLEGRGLRRRTGANGNQALNQAHYAILGLVGSSGLTEPPDAMLSAIRDGIDLLRSNGAGNEIKGHRDGYATACPGGPLYAWVQKGAPRPESDGEKPAAGGGQAKPVVDLSKLVAAARTDPPKKGTPVSYAGAKVVEQALVKEGLLAKGLADGHFGSATVAAYAKLQRRYGYTGRDADGIPGKTTLTRLGKAHGFTVKD
ncbi:N-acetylmuramoyl-L-alanine amidase [Streptomyces globisporus]|uniref:peptidoglycan-binding protein n=1 Tax=Streptomyces globisporus TaxID=1908 RepID=UPI00386EF5AE|nr:N-acetylmuramoyl-L-alanine amidase [Streptomyces globisporus]